MQNELNNSENEWLRTDERIETISDFEMFSEQLKQIIENSHRWKWAIITLHSGLQGIMVLALQGSSGLGVLREKDARKWLNWHRSNQANKDESPPRNLRLASFLELYKRTKGDKMIMFGHSQKFIPKGTQNESIRGLNKFRNDFTHFTPKLWSIELGGLPAIMSDCLEIAEFLAWGSGNVFLYEYDNDKQGPGLVERLKAAFASAHESLDILSRQYQ